MYRWYFALLVTICACLGEACGQGWSDPVLIDSPYDTLGININQREWCPFITADGQYFYFASERSQVNNDIYVCHWTGQGWSRPLMLPFCQLAVDERQPAANPTNDTLYFISYDGIGGWDIFWSFRDGPCDTCWGQPQRMPEPINSIGGIEFSVWPTPDNQRLLFSSWRVAADNEDIYECRRDASTPTGWSDPVPLRGQLNTWDIESYPSMGYDTTELFFWGRGDQLCVSHYGADSGWSFGTPLPTNINRIIIRDPSEVTPCITADGHRLYFSSRWAGDSTANSGAIWYSDRILAVPHENRSHDNREGRLIRVYPNPDRGEITIDMSGGLKRAMLFDVLGREIASMEFVITGQPIRWNMALDAGALASGTYFLVGQSRTAKGAVQIHILK